MTANSQNIGIIRKTKEEFAASKIIVFGEDVQADTDFKVVWDFLHSGASGYVTELDNVSDMLVCVEDVIMEKRYISNHVFIRRLEKLNAGEKNRTWLPGTLTTKESEIASYLLEGMSTGLIAQKLKRKASTISTIKNNVHKKIGVDNVMKLKEIFDSSPSSQFGNNIKAAGST